jgi:hypothetical protein
MQAGLQRRVVLRGRDISAGLIHFPDLRFEVIEELINRQVFTAAVAGRHFASHPPSKPMAIKPSASRQKEIIT